MTSGNGFSSNPDSTLDWNLQLRVSVPDPVPGYFDRPDLVKQLMATDHQITVLKARGIRQDRLARCLLSTAQRARHSYCLATG